MAHISAQPVRHGEKSKMNSNENSTTFVLFEEPSAEYIFYKIKEVEHHLRIKLSLDMFSSSELTFDGFKIYIMKSYLPFDLCATSVPCNVDITIDWAHFDLLGVKQDQITRLRDYFFKFYYVLQLYTNHSFENNENGVHHNNYTMFNSNAKRAIEHLWAAYNEIMNRIQIVLDQTKANEMNPHLSDDDFIYFKDHGPYEVNSLELTLGVGKIKFYTNGTIKYFPEIR